jgi:hypothetical protein
MLTLSRLRNICKSDASIVLLLALAASVVSCGGGAGSSGGDSGTDNPTLPKEETLSWQRTQVAELAGGGMLIPNVQATVDAQGVAHVVYFDDAGAAETPYRLRHVTVDIDRSARVTASAAETVVELDNSSALAVDPGGVAGPLVAYQGGLKRECGSEQQSDAMISVNDAGAWEEYTAAIGDVERNPVFTDGLAGGSMSVATDSQGNIHLCYQFFYEGCDAMNFRYPDLRYVWIDRDQIETYSPVEETVEGNDYVNENVQNTVGEHCAIVVDGNDDPAVFYYAVLADHTNGLRVARRHEGEWQTEWVEQGCEVGAISGAVSAADGSLAVAYYVRSYNEETDDGHTLKYADLEEGSWKVQVVDETARCGDHCSLAFDAQDRPGIAYYEMTNHSGYERKNLKLALFDGSTWERETVEDDGDIGLYNSLAFDGDDHPMIWTYSQTERSIYTYYKGETPTD